jgi:FKBP-type peptidyl-prolyl cis-trans isomerase
MFRRVLILWRLKILKTWLCSLLKIWMRNQLALAPLQQTFNYENLVHYSSRLSVAATCTKRTVTVHYVGKFTDGTIFDSSVKRKQPFTFQVGVGHVIEGWEIGIPLFKEGGKGKLIIPPHLGYGDKQLNNNIPPNSILIYNIEVIKVE